MTATLLLLLKAAVGVIIFAIGMDSTAKDAAHLAHRPGLLLRSVLAMYVGVPLAAFALVKLFFFQSEHFSQQSFIIALIWSAYNSFIIYLALREILTKRHERKKYRFPVVAKGEILDAFSGKVIVESVVIDLSITGAGVLADKEAPEDSRLLNLKVKPEKFADFTLPIEKLTNRWRQQTGKNSIGIAFNEDLGSQRSQLFEYLFIHLPRSDESSLYHVNRWDPFKIFRRSNS